MDVKKACVFASGEVSDYNYINKRVDKQSYIICADGGLTHCKQCGLTPDIVIGDMDSYNQSVDDFLCIKHPCEKDDTDTALCIKHAIEKGYKNIEIYGALGGRLDHTYANIQLLSFCKERDVDCILTDQKETLFLLKNQTKEILVKKGTTLSVFVYSVKAKGVTLKGVKYPLDNAEMTNSFPLGISNIALEEKISIGVTEGSLLVIISQ